MAEGATEAAGAAPAVSEAQLRKAEAYIEAEEGVVNRLAGWAGIAINPMTITTPNIMIIIAISSSDNTQFAYFRALDSGLTRKEAVRHALAHNLWPTFFSCLMVATGFLSLITMTIPPMQDLGILVGIGTMLVFLLILLFQGPLMVLLPIKPKRRAGAVRKADDLDRPRERASALSLRPPRSRRTPARRSALSARCSRPEADPLVRLRPHPPATCMVRCRPLPRKARRNKRQPASELLSTSSESGRRKTTNMSPGRAISTVDTSPPPCAATSSAAASTLKATNSPSFASPTGSPSPTSTARGVVWASKRE